MRMRSGATRPPDAIAQIIVVLAGSSITLFSSLPIFSISIRTTSPVFVFRVRAWRELTC
jgi:hypothetical protein